jgi:hypothetical protein
MYVAYTINRVGTAIFTSQIKYIDHTRTTTNNLLGDLKIDSSVLNPSYIMSKHIHVLCFEV